VTRRSTTDAGELDAQLATIRQTRLAVEVDEFIPRLSCMAAPVSDSLGQVRGAVSVSVSTTDFEARRKVIEAAVRLGAGQLATTFG
jgi:DNA-binding IclR family transcriptional regulator